MDIVPVSVKRTAESRLANILLNTPFRGRSPRIQTPPTTAVPSVPPQSAGIISEVPVNDDEAERRKRRIENHTRSVMSPGCHTPKDAANYERNGESNFTNVEIADHYTKCIKLSAENKINSKNAFGLHLIDYMAELLRKRGEMSNFQVAGCTLDASAKIYAGRVDSIYNDAFKMLGGIGRSEVNEENSENNNEEGNKRQPRGRKKGKKGKTGVPGCNIEKNAKTLNLKKIDLEFEVDPLFKKISKAIDEEGVEGLLVNQLQIDSDNCHLMLDSCLKPILIDSVSPSMPSIPEEHMANIKSEVETLLQSVVGKHVCPSLSDFRFNEEGNVKNDDFLHHLLSDGSMDNQSFEPNSVPDYTVVHPPCQSISDSQVDRPPSSLNDGDGGGDDYDDDYRDDAPTFMEVDDPPLPNGGPLSSYVIGDKQALTQIDPNTFESNNRPSMISGDLCLYDNIEISEYSYFNSQTLSLWKGPQHWKLIQKKKDDFQDKSSEGAITKTVKKRKSSRQVFRIDFTRTIASNLFKRGKINPVLSQKVIDKWNESLTTLPSDPHVDTSVLYQLFTRPQWKIHRKKATADALDEPLDGNIYEYGNPMDNADEDDNDNDNDSGNPFYNESLMEGGSQPPFLANDDLSDVVMGAKDFMSLLADSDLTGDNLIAEPKKVNLIHIQYAKHAKKMDVKKLKSVTWDTLTTTTTQPTHSTTPDEATASPSIPFTSLYSAVSKKLTPSMAQEMSISMFFVCLLHLTNEKILDIADLPDMSDLAISLTEHSPTV